MDTHAPEPNATPTIRRTRAVFGQLLARDPSARSWLPKLLSCAPKAGGAIPTKLREAPGALREATFENGACFGRPVPPTAAFLSWMIRHPDQLPRPEPLGRPDAADRRKMLFGFSGPENAAEITRTAIGEFETVGPAGSEGKWWAFEGFKPVDVCLSTDALLLFVECALAEPLDAPTRWWPERHAVVRSVEVARELAAGRQYGVMVIGEPGHPLSPGGIVDVDRDLFERGLPHLGGTDHRELSRHYLGFTSWAQVCGATGCTLT